MSELSDDRRNFFKHFHVWPRGRYYKFIADDTPAMLFIEPHRGHARSTPEGACVSLNLQSLFRVFENCTAQPAPLLIAAHRHPAQLPGGPCVEGPAHERRAPD